MVLSEFEKFSTGVLTPVTALRSENSIGTGEFADLPLLGSWVQASGLSIIQILPVNDTGSDSSPYSALSAFALHPLYLRLDDLPELQGHPKFAERLRLLRAELSGNARLEYGRVLAAKLEFLKALYAQQSTSSAQDKELKSWMGENAWVRDYAVFCVLKERNNGAAWWCWQEHHEPSTELIDAFWSQDATRTQLLFYAWVQYRLEQQLQSAKEALSSMGVLLKGDIPILMNEDSVDLWRRRAFFRVDLRAGAPPDMFSALGQNWGFPIYNWQELEKDDYSWWRARVRRAAKFYHAYRIDHVLGFFRIWAIPAEHRTGILGRFEPGSALSLAELNAAGFSADRIRWLAEPHISGQMLRDALGHEADSCIEEFLEQIGQEDLYLFKASIAGERGICAGELSVEAKELLVSQYRNRALLRVTDDTYVPSWSFRQCDRYHVLDEGEKQLFEGLVHRVGQENEEVWQEHGLKTLRMMRETVNILPCAEDLGVVPDSVPEVLGSLGILSLKLPRWTRDYDQAGEPFVPLEQYPFLSVCAPSVHDTSTLREWWEAELSGEERNAFWALLGRDGNVPANYDAGTAAQVIGSVLKTRSVFCVFQLQDLFALETELCFANPCDERVNVPGTANEFNWSYRIPENLEDLVQRAELIETIRELVQDRNQRSIP